MNIVCSQLCSAQSALKYVVAVLLLILYTCLFLKSRVKEQYSIELLTSPGKKDYLNNIK
jgi:hypothetical protein